VETGMLSIEDSAARVMALLRERGIVRE